MRLIFCILILLCPYMNQAQQTKPVSALKIGDTIPAIVITNLYNYPALTIPLSSLKGKLIILDFWSTWCGSCIEAFPKMQRLQKEFGNQLQVVLVNTYTGDDIKRVKPFFENYRRNTGEAVTLPYGLLQASLAEYFPFKYVPHYVWIDVEGKLIAITSQFEITGENIKAALLGKLVVRTKQDLPDFNNTKPLFIDGNGGDGNAFLYRSIFTGYMEGMGNIGGIERTKDGKITRFYLVNNAAITLLRTAYPGKLEGPFNSILIEAKQANKFMPGATEDTLLYKNSFCYDLSVPPCTLGELQEYMQQDIYRVFHIRVKSEERMRSCIILKAGENSKKLYTKGGSPVMDFNKNSRRKYLQNQPVGMLTDLLNNLPAMRQRPVIDDTRITGNIDIDLPEDITGRSLSSLLTFLKQAGFEIQEAGRNMPVTLITDQSP